MEIKDASKNDIAEISPALAWNLQLQLKTSTGDLVAKLVNPSFPWETVSEMYDCKDKKLAGMKWQLKILDIFTNMIWWGTRAGSTEIFDASGTKVADMETSNPADKYTRTLKILDGQNVIQLAMDKVFFIPKTAEITNVNAGASLPPLLQDARFLSLLAAGEMNGHVSLLAHLVAWIPLFLCCLCCCCRVCCSKYKVGDRVEGLYKDGYWYKATIDKVNIGGTYTLGWDDPPQDDTVKPAEKIRPQQVAAEKFEEQRPLVGANDANTSKEVQQAPSLLNFCCRRAAPAPSGNAPH